jgi:nicotinamidase-related amidase
MRGFESAPTTQLTHGTIALSNQIRRALSQWGAFYGTELDLQLRRRGIDTILLAGISTNVGVESTARDA